MRQRTAGQRRRSSDQRRRSIRHLEVRGERRAGAIGASSDSPSAARVRCRPHRHASEAVQRIRRHRRGHRPQCGHQGADHRSVVRWRRRRVGVLRPGHRDHQPRPYTGVSGLFDASSSNRRSVIAVCRRRCQRRRPCRPGADRHPNDRSRRPSRCARCSAHGTQRAIVAQPGKHACLSQECFRRGTARAGRTVDTPGVARIPVLADLAARLGFGSARRASRPVTLPVWTRRGTYALMASIWFALNPAIFPKINDERS